jgi:hypothetical protein
MPKTHYFWHFFRTLMIFRGLLNFLSTNGPQIRSLIILVGGGQKNFPNGKYSSVKKNSAAIFYYGKYIFQNRKYFFMGENIFP